MAGVNKVILVGNLGKDPEVRTLQNGTKVANFSMAISEKWVDKNTGEVKQNTEWVNIVIWRKLAEIVEKYLKKGSQIYVEGKLQTRSWEKDGITRYTTEVLVNNMVMLGGNRESVKSVATAPVQDQSASQAKEVGEDIDDLPF